MNMLLCQSLNLVINVYLDQRDRGTARNDQLYDHACNLIDSATQDGLITWVSNLPMINMRKFNDK